MEKKTIKSCYHCSSPLQHFSGNGEGGKKENLINIIMRVIQTRILFFKKGWLAVI